MKLASARNLALSVLIGAALGTLAGLLLGWAASSHGIMSNSHALRWAGFGAGAGTLTGHLLASLRHKPFIGILPSILLGSGLGLLMALAFRLSYPAWFSPVMWMTYTLSGGAAGLLSGLWRLTERLDAKLRHSLAIASQHTRILWLIVAQGGWLGLAAGMVLGVIFITKYTARGTYPYYSDFGRASGYYLLLPLCALVGLGLSGWRALLTKSAPPTDDFAHGLTCGLLGSLILFTARVVTMVILLPTQGFDASLPLPPSDLLFFLFMATLITLFAITLSNLTAALLPIPATHTHAATSTPVSQHLV